MKKTTTPLKKQLIRALLVSLLCGFSLPALAQADNDGDGDGNAPPTYPPIRRIQQQAMAVVQQSTNLEIVFLEEANDVQLEVVNQQGEVVITAFATVATNERVRISAERWKKGYYTVRVTRKNKSNSVATVLLR